jgi:hypothetical protein
MDLLRFAGWFVVHVGVPIFAPIGLLPLLRLARTFRTSAKGIVAKSIRDGQLFWTVIALCAETCYELAGYQEHATGLGSTIAWAGLFLHVGIIVFAAGLVLLGAIDTLALSMQPDDQAKPIIMLISVWTTAAVAVSFSTVHVLILYVG